VRATWAPRGKTPVLRHRFSWTRLSMSGALGYRPDASQAALMFQIKPGVERRSGFPWREAVAAPGTPMVTPGQVGSLAAAPCR